MAIRVPKGFCFVAVRFHMDCELEVGWMRLADGGLSRLVRKGNL